MDRSGHLTGKDIVILFLTVNSCQFVRFLHKRNKFVRCMGAGFPDILLSGNKGEEQRYA